MPRLAQTQQRLFGLLPLAALGSVWAPASVIGCRYASSSATGGDSAAAAAGSTPPSSTPQPPAVGTVFTRSRLYTSEEVSTFCTLTGDSNAIHIDGGGAAAAAGLPGAILPGLLMAALFPAIIGSHFPGALYLSQSLKFKRYALVGESVTATLTVERSSGSRVSFRTLCCATGSGRVLVEGDALALIRGPQSTQHQRQSEEQQAAAAEEQMP